MFAALSLKKKFLALESTSFAMFVAMAFFALFMLKGSVDAEKEGVERLKADIMVMEHISTMDIAFLKQTKHAKNVWMRGEDAEKKKKYRAGFVEERERFERSLQAASAGLKQLALGHEQEFTGFLGKLGALAEMHQTVSDQYLAQIDAHRADAMGSDAKVEGLDRPVLAQVSELRDGFVAFTEQKAAEKITMAQEDYEHRRNVIVAWVLASLAISFLLATVIIRQVMRQLGGDPRDVAAVVNTMAQGDFSRQPAGQPVPGSLLANAYQMQASLRDMIGQVKSQAHHVGDMAHSLATSANQIAKNVNHESDAVSGMAAAIEELSVSTTHISDQGSNAKQIANSSRDSAQEGAKVVNMTVSGLLEIANEIESASGEVSRLGEDASRISDVVKVIKEIADQTNLLALNAAIEAARAGEQGRGFAVVADEVRKLAERTAGATNEISQMSSKIGEVAGNALSGMDKVVQTTRKGVGDAETAQTSIKHIQNSFSEVSGVIDDIAGALQEQNAAAAELAKSTEQVSQMSEENAGAAKSLLQLATELEDKASAVRQSVEVFKV
ncbi:MAG: methyl-accepting chemotaxis protein [Gammaproteobacteria bacterium]|nr:methyl-accepting chemotaxis protein [Sideroxydans sp.]MBU3902944.1 methyl-accepting chemotaxis protein [Gammaproteobacteria bacterium]MBU4045627.1 methyl-accepting chemotaxis protein [Gammaproteobacteria bacterium]MBU4150189.1 methyl-accepting chemotaxis protein [Gammaproteobacteria bacterium]